MTDRYLGSPDVTTAEGIAAAHRLEAAGWIALEVVLPRGYARLWVCPTCSATVLDPELHIEVLPHPHQPDLLADVAQRRTPEEWSVVARVSIHDPDGWRGPGGRPYDDRITRGEFDRRVSVSTIRPYCTQRPDCGHPRLHWHQKDGTITE